MFGLSLKKKAKAAPATSESPGAVQRRGKGRTIAAAIAGVVILVVAALFFFPDLSGGMMAGLMGDAPSPAATSGAQPKLRPVSTAPKSGATAAAATKPAPGNAASSSAAASTAPAEADLEEIYSKLHAATLAGDATEMRRYLTTGKRTGWSAMPKQDLATLINTMGSMMPQSYKVERKSVAQDGRTGVLLASGTSEFGKQEVHGVVNFQLEDGEWKVADWGWTPDKMDAAKAPAPKPVAAERTVHKKATPEPEVSDEAKPAVPAAERRKARQEEIHVAQQKRAEEDKRRMDEFNARCQIRPVMTDEEIQRCRPLQR